MEQDNGSSNASVNSDPVINSGNITINQPQEASINQVPSSGNEGISDLHSTVQTPAPISEAPNPTPTPLQTNQPLPSAPASSQPAPLEASPLQNEGQSPANPSVAAASTTGQTQTLINDEKPATNPIETLAAGNSATLQNQQVQAETVKPKSKIKLLLGILIPIIVLAAAAAGVWYYGNQKFEETIGAVDNGRDADWLLTVKATDLSNSIVVDAGNIYAGLSDANVTYEMMNTTYSNLENKSNEALRIYGDAENNIKSQKQKLADFKFSFVLSAPKKELYSKLKELIGKEAQLTAQSSANAKKESYAGLAIFRTFVDVKAVDESSAQETTAQALSVASSLQKYTRPDFAFDNETLYKADLPEAYNTVQSAKKLLSDYYSALAAVNAGDTATANQLLANFDSRVQDTGNALKNAFAEKNKAWANIYQDESGVADSYLIAMDKSGVKYHRNREVANYIMYNLEYQNYKDDKYPKVSDFDALKQTLGLKYGSKETIKYSAPSESEYLLEYEQDGTWFKLNNTYPSGNATAVS